MDSTIGIVVVLFSLVAIGGFVLAARSRKRREKRHAEEAARTDGQGYTGGPIIPDEVPGNVWGPK